MVDFVRRRSEKTEIGAGGHISQSDATSWMAMFSPNLMRISLKLAQHNHVHEDVATKFFEHFLIHQSCN